MLRNYSRDAEHLSCLRPVADAPDAVMPIWFDLINPTPSEDKTVEKQLAISIPTREEMEEIELSARLYQEDGAEFMTMTALTQLESDEPINTPDHVHPQGHSARDRALCRAQGLRAFVAARGASGPRRCLSAPASRS